MASTYTPLGIELMATGENAGTWGTKTNTNLQLFEQIAGGYASVTVNGTGATALSISDGATGANGAARVIILTGTITGNITVTLPLDVENFYAVKNATTGSFSVEFKYVSGTGNSFTWSTTQKDWRLFTAKADDATNPNIEEISLTTSPAGSNTQIQFNNAGSFGGSANLTWDGSNVFIAAEGDLRLGDNTGGEYVGLDAPATVSASYTITLPTAVAAGANYALTTTDASGNTQWTATSTFGISTGKAIAMAIVFG